MESTSHAPPEPVPYVDIRYVSWAINWVLDADVYEVIRYENGKVIHVGSEVNRELAWDSAERDRAYALQDLRCVETQPLESRVR